MSEYWKSTPKYWCKYCSAFVVDTPVQKKNHEATGKHQGSLKRFLRDLHRGNLDDARAADKAKREVDRLNRAVGGDGEASDAVSVPRPGASVGKPENSKGERWGVSKRPLTDDERRKQAQELAALGVALPEQYRKEAAMPGEWETVSVTRKTAAQTEKERVMEESRKDAIKESEEVERKRKWDKMDDEEKEIRSFKIKEKTLDDVQEDFAPTKGVKFGFKKHKAEMHPVQVKSEGHKEPEGIKFEVKGKGIHVPKALLKDEEGHESRAELDKGERLPESPRMKQEHEEEEEEVAQPAAETTVKSLGEDASIGIGVVFKKRKVKNIRPAR